MPDIEIPVTLVINVCHGGFGLSAAARRELARRKGVKLYEPVGGVAYLSTEGTHPVIEKTLRRDDPDLVAVVREMGSAASGIGADLRVVTVPITVDVENHSGREEVTAYGGAYTYETQAR